jgi:hypothetical protein
MLYIVCTPYNIVYRSPSKCESDDPSHGTKVTKVKLSLKEKLDFFPAVVSIVIAYIYALLTGLRRSERQAKSLSLH